MISREISTVNFWELSYRSFYADFYSEIRDFQGWICECLLTLSVLAK